ncbi:2-dehydropantoate 2-reductase (Ketopantoate reductase) (KPA reductase) (KPR) [Sporothrix bragantina]|uniref:2-dehydropantoate 2-reductase (Ketopantoate reductase) (KPA reductase) (KPR) n=1 Tax=Sporothrix bragantina TaxID=671064 RepID=A0ABP0BCP7_9PEZI
MLDEELDEKMGNGRSSTQAPAPRDTLDESAKPAETVPSTADNATMLDDDIIRLKKPSTMIYIVGGNPEATYLAHSLSILPYMPRVQMLLLSRKFAHNWVREGREVQVLRPGLKPTSKKLRAYLMKSPPSATRQLSKRPLKGRLTRFAPTGTYYKQPIIRNLIITQACAPSIIAVGRLKHRLDNNSTICLVQPGLGVVERLNELFFPDPLTRPRYILAHMTHTLGYTNRSLSVAELKVGRLMLTLYDPPGWRQTATEAVTAEAQRRAQKALPRTPRTPGPDPQSPVPIRPGDLHALDFINEFSTPVPNERLEDDAKIPFQGKNSPLGRSMAYCGLHLMYLMGITPTLHTDFYRYSTFLQHKLPDMITTSATETVATMLDLSLSGGLMNNPEARLMIGRLVTEMISVAVALPETKNDPKLHWFVASGRLKRRINHLLHQHYFHNKDKDGVRRIGDFGDGGHYDRHRGPFVSEGPCRMALRTSLGRRSDIQFLNGYFVRRGLEVGVACPWNEMAIHVVQAKRLANKSNTTKTVNEHSLASKDVRDAIVFVHQATQKRAAANDKELQPKHASAAGKFPWKDFVKDKDATARESTMDTTQTKEYSA